MGRFREDSAFHLLLCNLGSQSPSLSMFPSQDSKATLEPHSWIQILVQPLSSCEIEAKSFSASDPHGC